MFPTQFHNFERDHRFEETAIKYFESITGSTTSKCVFFVHPSDEKYGASPDAICPGATLLEIQTRAENSTSPLDSLKGEHLIQTQLQMACTGFDYVIVESFHPESNSANFFLVRKDELLLSVLKDITDSILKQTPVDRWDHVERRVFQLLGEKLTSTIPNFTSLKTLRVYINKVAKSLPRLKFT